MGRRIRAERILVCVLAVATLASCTDGLLQGLDDHLERTDQDFPTAGDMGRLTVEVHTVDAHVWWTEASDITVDSERLQYRVYTAESGKMDTKADVLSNGTPATDWTNSR